MMFGRKKKADDAVALDEESPPSYGVDVDDDSSDGGSSVPPPPPGITSQSEMFRDEASQNTNEGNVEDHVDPTGERKDNGISFLTDSADDEALFKELKQQDPNRRKKFLLIFAFIATLAILVGLTIKYASRSPSESSVSSSQSEASSQESVFGTSPPQSITPVATGNPVPAEPAQTPRPTATTAALPAAPTEAPTEGGTDESTADATDESTEDATEESTAGATEESTAGATDSFAGPGELDCVVDQIFASSSCAGGETSATVNICMTGAIDDQFWEWISTPTTYEATAENDWGWLSDGMTIQRNGIPTGFYEIGLYANGNQGGDYPLITSTRFQVRCSRPAGQ